MEYVQVLRPLEQLERRLADLYAWFGELFADDAEAAFVFHQMFLEERAHVNLIDYQRRLARGNPGVFGDVEVSLDKVEAGIARIDAVRSASPSPDLPAAIRFALELEASAANYHLRAALRQSSPDMARLMDSLGRADRQHVGALRRLAETRGLV